MIKWARRTLYLPNTRLRSFMASLGCIFQNCFRRAIAQDPVETLSSFRFDDRGLIELAIIPSHRPSITDRDWAYSIAAYQRDDGKSWEQNQ